MGDLEFRMLAGCRISLARLVEQLGDSQSAERILGENVKLLTSSRAKAVSPTSALALLLTRQELARINPRYVSPSLGHLSVVEQREPYFVLFSPEAERFSAREWAEQAWTVFESIPGCEPGAGEESVIGLRFVELLFTEAASARHSHRLDLSRKIADRMYAFASIFVSRRPDQPDAHLALSMAYAQFYKNASRISDRPGVETNMRLALAAAQKALLLDIRSDRIRHEVAQLERKLKGIAPSR
jgi:hypothetical protein